MGVNANKNIQSKNDWEEIYFLSLGTYFQTIINELSKEVDVANLTEKTFVSNELIPIPKHWKWFQIKDVIEFSTNINIEKELPADAIVNYIDIDAIDNKRYQIREVKQRFVSELSSRARRVLKKNYLLYSLVRPYLNNIALIEDDRSNFIGSTGFAVFKGTLVDNTFLKYFLLSDFVRERYLNMLSGFNSPSITQEQFTSTPIPVPPLSEQKKIIHFLNRLERNEIEELGKHLSYNVESKIIKLHNAQLNGIIIKKELDNQQTYLQQLRQSILQEAVQGKLTQQDPTDEPASKLLERIKAEKQKLITAGKLKKEKELSSIAEDEIPFALPTGWVWCRLGKVTLKVTDGFHNTPPRVKDGYPYVLATQIKSEGIDFENCSYVSEKDHKELWAKAYPQKGEILLVNIGAGCGTPAIIDVDFEFSFKNSAIVKQPKEIDSLYLFNYLLSIRETVYNEVIQGGAQPYLSLKMIENLLFPLPPLPEQQRIVAKVQQLLQMINQLERQVQKSQTQAQQLLQAVLKEAFSSKAKVYEENELLTMAAEE